VLSGRHQRTLDAVCAQDPKHLLGIESEVRDEGSARALFGSYLSCRFVALGTDGFGRSDTRAALRRLLDIDRSSIVVSALQALSGEGSISRDIVAQAVARYQIQPDAPSLWTT
jgi:pyruvate dehydrogenase complex dehydrogenase (E1) component